MTNWANEVKNQQKLVDGLKAELKEIKASRDSVSKRAEAVIRELRSSLEGAAKIEEQLDDEIADENQSLGFLTSEVEWLDGLLDLQKKLDKGADPKTLDSDLKKYGVKKREPDAVEKEMKVLIKEQEGEASSKLSKGPQQWAKLKAQHETAVSSIQKLLSNWKG